VKPVKHVREFRTAEDSDLKSGSILTVRMFKPGEKVTVSGVSKGKGFQGVVRRWGFKGGRASHGAETHRRPGSIGNSADPSRVFKNKKMPGRMGHAAVTVKNLDVMMVDPARNLLCLKGSVPGHRGGLLKIVPSRKGANG